MTPEQAVSSAFILIAIGLFAGIGWTIFQMFD